MYQEVKDEKNRLRAILSLLLDRLQQAIIATDASVFEGSEVTKASHEMLFGAKGSYLLAARELVELYGKLEGDDTPEIYASISGEDARVTIQAQDKALIEDFIKRRQAETGLMRTEIMPA